MSRPVLCLALLVLAACNPASRFPGRREGDAVYRLEVGVTGAPEGRLVAGLTAWVHRPDEPVRPVRLTRSVRVPRGGGVDDLRFDLVGPTNPERIDLTLDLDLADGRRLTRSYEAGVLFAKGREERIWLRIPPRDG